MPWKWTNSNCGSSGMETLDTRFKSRYIMKPVAVESNQLKPLNSTLALGLIRRVSTEGRAKWLFLCLYATVPLTIVSAHVCGSEGGKRISLTQGGRLHEGSTPSDKRPSRLMDCCRDKFSGSINKAVDGIKGQTPMLTPNWVKVGVLLIIIPTVALVCPKGI